MTVAQAGLYRVRLVANPKGSRRRILALDRAPLRFSASQKDKAADDYPEKILRLSDAQARELSGMPDFEVRPFRGDATVRRSPVSDRATTRAIGKNPAPAGDDAAVTADSNQEV